MTRPALRIEYPLTRDLEQDLRRVPTAVPGAVRQWTDDLLRPHGLEARDVPEDGPLAWSTSPTPSGWVLVVQPVVERTADEVGLVDLVPLPDGTRLEELGWEVEGDAWNRPADAEPDEPEGRSVAGEDLPRSAQALVTAWWHEVQTAGRVARPVVEWTDLDVQANEARGFVFYGRGELPLEVALEYAARLERSAGDLRAAVERKRADAATRDEEYADAIGTLAARDVQQPGYDAMIRAAELIESGRARIGRAGETWCLTDAPPEE